MDIRPTRIFPLGDSAVTVEFGSEMSAEVNAAAIALADHFTVHPFPGFVEAVPAIASTTIFYVPAEVKAAEFRFETAFESVRDLITHALEALKIVPAGAGRLVTVPVSFLPADALDLEEIAGHCELDPEAVIEIFLSQEYRVFMLGFLPGFPYMGIVDDRIATPRLATPRISVPKGSVGIAGRQAGIYPAASPGGWRIIGRTDIELFDPNNDPPCYFAPGDRVRFVRKSG